jgi:hypothetical protein
MQDIRSISLLNKNNTDPLPERKIRGNSQNDNAEAVENSTGSLIICYVSSHTVNFRCIIPYSIPALRLIGWYAESDF